jgi:hypothetical protein
MYKLSNVHDLLTSGFGVIRDSIPFDVRVVGALRHVGINIPADALKNSKSYAELERDVVIQICRPLRLTGAELDLNWPDTRPR